MADLKVRIFKGGKTEPDTTVTIPGRVLHIARKLVPAQAAAALQDRGIDLDALISLSNNAEIDGTVVEIEDHKKSEKIVVSLEQTRRRE